MNYPPTTEQYNEFVSKMMQRAYAIKTVAIDFNFDYLRADLEDAILRRDNCTIEQAAEKWLIDDMLKAFETDDRKFCEAFIKIHNI